MYKIVPMPEYPLALCTVMLLDLLVPAGQPPEEPAVLKRLVHELLGKALRGLPQNSRIAIESMGGAVVCFMGDPEDALRSALLLRQLLSQRYGTLMSVRIALEIGQVRVTADRNDQVRVDGNGVHQAALVKAQARPDDVLVSRGYQALLSRLNPGTADLFQYHGPTEERPIEVFSVIEPIRAAGDPGDSFIVTKPVALPESDWIDADTVEDIEAELAGYIGPLSHVLVRKARGHATSAQEMRDMLAPALQNPQTREFFLVGKLSQLNSRPAEEREAAIPAPDPAAGAPVPPPLHDTRQVDIAPAELAIIAHTLQRFIGPLAQPLMRREIDLYVRFGDFVQALAGGIDHPGQREVFLQALQRSLPERRI